MMLVCADIFGRHGPARRVGARRGSAGRVMLGSVIIGNALRGVAWFCMAGLARNGDVTHGEAMLGWAGNASQGMDWHSVEGQARRCNVEQCTFLRGRQSWAMLGAAVHGTARLGWSWYGYVRLCSARLALFGKDVCGRAGRYLARRGWRGRVRLGATLCGRAGTATGTDPWRLGETSGFSTDKEAVCQKQ